MTALPPIYYLHVWWARRPLVASRAAVLASLLPADADRSRFLHVLGIHGDPVATRSRIDAAKRTGENLGPDPYGYRRAFTYAPSDEDKDWLASATRRPLSSISVLDPSAGGGSIPMETERLGTASLANDLNPVAALILMATVGWPFRHGSAGRSRSTRVCFLLNPMAFRSSVICGRGPSPVRTATGSFRSRQTGGLHPAAPASG